MSYILHEKARQYYWEGQESLSIKTFFSGRAVYRLGRGYYAVDDASYLIVNHAQPYSICIESNAAVESFCLFFEPGFAEEVQRSIGTRTEILLDEPAGVDARPLHFFDRTYRHDDLLSPLLFHLRANLNNKKHEALWLEERFHLVMERLLQLHHNIDEEIGSIPALRATTRRELYQRLYRAKEYATALFDTPLTLAELAAVASLSPNHFLRMFKQFFHQTPHQYIISHRLERAQYLLRHTDQTVTEICFALGFESPGSFSWLFHRQIGSSPSAYRSAKK